MLLSGRILYPVRTADDSNAEAQLTALAQRGGHTVSLLGHASRSGQNDHEDVLRAVAARLEDGGVSVAHTDAAKGNWADAILRYALQTQPDLIFVSAGEAAHDDVHGADPQAQMVARHAEASVWLAKPHTPPAIDTVVCAVDGSPGSADALRASLDLCRGLNMRLCTVRSIRSPAENDPLTLAMSEAERNEAADSAKARIEREHEAFLQEFRYDGIVNVQHRLLWRPRASDALLDIANEHVNDLLVLGPAGKRRFLWPMLGTTSERVLRGAACSLLFARP